MAGSLPAGCRDAAWFSSEAKTRGLRARTTVTIAREGEELVGKIWFLDGGAGDEAREVRSPTCDAVADTLVLIAEVHERPSSGPMPASAVLSVPPPATGASATPSIDPSPTSAGMAALPHEPPPMPSAIRPLSVGIAVAADSAVAPGFALGGAVFGRFTPRSSLLATGGWATLSVGYLAGSTDVAGVHVSHRRWLGQLAIVPYAWPVSPSTRVGLAIDVAFARLGVEAEVPAARDDVRSMWGVGVGPRLLTLFGPMSVEVGAGLVVPISRRRFVLPDREEPVFRLPPAAFGGFLALGSR